MGQLITENPVFSPISKRTMGSSRESLSLNKSASTLTDWIKTYCSNHIDFNLVTERRCLPPNFFQDFASKGLFGIMDEHHYGGLGLQMPEMLDILTACGEVDMSIGITLALHNILGTPLARKLVSTEDRHAINSGRAFVAFALTEEAAGSAPRGITTELRKDQSGYTLHGSKIWTGLGSWARFIIVFAKDDSGKIRACLVDRDMSDFQIDGEHKTMGLNGLAQAKLTFAGTKVESHMVFEGDGLELAKKQMTLGRLAVSAICLGAMKLCQKVVLNYTHSRKIARGFMCDNPLINERLWEIDFHIKALTAYMEHVKSLITAGKDFSRACLIAKIIIPEALHLVLDQSLQLLGGRGYMENNILARFYRDARIFRIFEGPTEALTGHLGHMLTLDKSDEFSSVGKYNPVKWIAAVKGIKNRKHFIHATYYLGDLYATYEAYSKVSLSSNAIYQGYYEVLLDKKLNAFQRTLDQTVSQQKFPHTLQPLSTLQYGELNGLDKYLYHD